MNGIQQPDPLFARRASELLENGLVDEAIAVCLEGTTLYPWYATGALVLGECYEAKGKYAEAAEHYRRALAIHPDSYLVHRLLTASEQQMQSSRPTEPVEEQHGESVTDVLQDTDAGGSTGESGVEFMLRRLAEAKGSSQGGPSPSASGDAGKKGSPSSRIVTVTLAEIYASQGEYHEALRAYRRLVEQRPEEADRFQHRLAELEELARLQKGSS